MGIELLAGRDFGPDDRASSPPVVIVSEELVERYFGAGTPVQSVIGREIAPLIYQETRPTVVGVVRSTRHRSPEAPVAPEIYTPLSQLAVDAMTLVVRGEPEQVAAAVAAAAAQVDAEQRWSPLLEYTTYLREWFAPLRLQVLLIGVLGALGLLLASLSAELRPFIRELLERMPRPERFPAYDGIIAGEDGRVWVGAYAGQLEIVYPPLELRAPERRWLVFDADGALTASVHTPEGFEPFAVRDGRVWGVYTDTLDIESVRAYEVVRP